MIKDIKQGKVSQFQDITMDGVPPHDQAEQQDADMKLTPIEELDEQEHQEAEAHASSDYSPTTPAQSIAEPPEVPQELDLDFNMEPAEDIGQTAAEPMAEEESAQSRHGRGFECTSHGTIFSGSK